MSPVRRIAASVAAVSAVAALALAPPASAGTAAPRTTTDPAEAAAGWVAQQLRGGTHLVGEFSGTEYVDYGNTIGTAWALAAAGVGKPTMDAVTGYIAKHLEEYVDYSGAQGGPYDGSIGKAAVAALVDGRDPNRFGGHHLLAELKAHECPTKSTGCTPGDNEGIFSTISTSLIVIAEARGARHDGDEFAPSDALVQFLLDQQCDNGGFSSAVRTADSDPCASDVDATGYAVMALQALGGQSDAIGAAAAWLVSSRQPNGTWKSQGGANINSTALATVALHAAGRSTRTSQAWLRRQQITAGATVGPGATRGALKYQGSFDPINSVLATNDGVLGLTRSSLATLNDKGVRGALPLLALDRPTLTDRRVARGATDKVTGTGFAGHEKVAVTIGSHHIGADRSNEDGTTGVRFDAPKSLSRGKHTITLTGHRSNLQSKATIVIK